MQKEEVMRVLCEEYEGVFHKKAPRDDVNLLDPSVNNAVFEYLYWFDRLERRFGFAVCKLLETNDYSVMTIARLAEAIYGIYG